MKLRTTWRHFFIGCSLLALLPQAVYATSHASAIMSTVQDNKSTLKGVVVDENGEPLVGATVKVLTQTGKGAITDLNGNFSLSALSATDEIEITVIGYQSHRFTVGSQKSVRVQLKPDTHKLDEVIVVGYASQRKESLTGSLQSISPKDLKTVSTPAVENLLNSKAPGVYVAPGSGQPGATGAVMIRGKSTVNGSTAPLWVIDGVIVGNTPGSLSPNDIESLTILKDAASTAVYGSQGANGVIVVTTKHAASGKLQVEVSSVGGISRLNMGNLKMMNGAELYDLYKSFDNQQAVKFPRWNPELRNSNFDWWDFGTRTGIFQDHHISLSGGTDKISTMASLGVYDEKGAVRGYHYTRYNAMLKTSYKPFKWLTIKPYASASFRNVDDRQHSVGALYSNLPWDSPLLPNGSPTPHRSETWVNAQGTNYYYDLQWNKSASRTYELSGNLDVDIKLTDWLTFASVNNLKHWQYSSSGYVDPRSAGGEGVKGRISEYRSEWVRRYTNQLLRFNRQWGKHAVNGVLGYEYNDFRSSLLDVTGIGMVAGIEILDTTSKPERAKGNIFEWAVQSFLSNLNYAYDDRYLLQLSFRRDGASNFGKNAQYGNFFSVSGGWNIHKEAFFNTDVLDQLKLRAAYGSVGNRPDALYPQYSLYSASSGVSYNGNPGMLISQIGNDDLTWEKSYTTGVGVDVSVLNKVRLTLDYYIRNTSDLLYQVPVSSMNGVTSVWRNVGAVFNHGVEASVSADLISTNDWYWNVSANISANRNKVTNLYGQKDPVTGEVPPIIIGGGSGISGEANRILKVGYSADTWYLTEWAGVDPQDGSPTWYKTVNTNGVQSREVTHNYAEADKVMLGEASPKCFGGFATQLRWKKLDMNAMFGYAVGGKLYNYTRTEYDSDGAYTDRNQMRLMKGWKRWEKPGDVATHPKAMYNNTSKSQRASSRYLEDASFLKLRSLSLGYNLDASKWGIQNMRLFVTGENLFTLTPYSGVDPELPPASDGKMIGVTTAVYPSTRKFSVGLNLTF